MQIQAADPDDRLARIEQRIEDYRVAKQRRLLQRAIKLWRKTIGGSSRLKRSPPRLH